MTAHEQAAGAQLGILAFGSLIRDPGALAPYIVATRIVTTPFPVEFARSSRSRGGAPTLVPVDGRGSRVQARVFELRPGISRAQAQTLLWQREIHQHDRSATYARPQHPGVNSVVVDALEPFDGLACALYTRIQANLATATPDELARRALASVRAMRTAGDAISYLIEAIADGIVTPKSDAYRACVLTLSGQTSLEAAREWAREHAVAD